ncbi:MAG: hypothetical protein [Bacteriophage sp.]|nr:MAG: hypothetical protein [Bacteriophage sp.]
MKWTKEEITEFNRLYQLSGGNQMERIESRLFMPGFVANTGEAKCEAMYKHITNGGELDGIE